MTENTLAVPTKIDEATERIIRECELLAENYKTFTIATQQHYDEAIVLGKSAAVKRKQLKQLDEAFCGPIKKLYQEMHAKFARGIDALETTQSMFARITGAFQAQKEAEQREAQRKLDAERDEKERKAREAAEKARAAGNEAKAEKLEAKADAVATAVTVAAPTIQKQEDAAGRMYYFARVTAPGAVPREYCIPDESALKALSTATKGTAKVAGVVFWGEKRTAFGAKP